MSYYESQSYDGGQAYAEGYEGQGYDYNYDGNYQGEDGSQYAGQTEWANGESGYDPSWNADETNQYYYDENGAPYYDENGGYYDESGNYVYPNNAAVDDGTAQGGTVATVNYTADAAALSPPVSSSSSSSCSLNPEQDSQLPRSNSSNMLAQLAEDFSLDSASSSTSSPSISMYLKSAVAEASVKTRPPPPRLRNGEIPSYYDDEETGYQYYVDDDGNTQWDLVGYYEVDGEYVYYEDVETEDSTRAFAEELENYKHQYNDDEKTDKETDEERKARHRAAVSKEIIETEKSYVESLDILVKKYMGPLVASGVLDKDARSNIFSNIPALYSLNNALLRDLLLVDETTKLTPTGKSFADIWLGTVEYFKMYSAYCTNYPNALKFTQALQKQKPQFAIFCREMKNTSTTKLDLTDYLIKPVQRICKYPLLFRELIKNTDETDKEYAKLVEIEKRLQLVAGHVNEAKRMAENLQSVAEIASSITDMPATFTLVEGHRKLLFRGTYSVQTNNKTPKSSELILFSDVIVQARPRNMLSKQLKFVAMLSIRSIIVRDPGDTRLELEDEETNLVVDFKEPLEKKKWQTEVINTKQQLQEEEINKALKTRPKRRQKPGEPHREAFANKDGSYTGDQEMSPRSGDDFENVDAEENAATSYDAIEKLIEKEEVRKREIDRRLLELDVKEKETRERLVAAKARNVELEREIAELQTKVQSLEVSASTASLPVVTPAAAPAVLEPAPPSSTFLSEQSIVPALLGPRSSTNLASTMRRPPPAPPSVVLNQS